MARVPGSTTCFYVFVRLVYMNDHSPHGFCDLELLGIKRKTTAIYTQKFGKHKKAFAVYVVLIKSDDLKDPATKQCYERP